MTCRLGMVASLPYTMVVSPSYELTTYEMPEFIYCAYGNSADRLNDEPSTSSLPSLAAPDSDWRLDESATLSRVRGAAYQHGLDRQADDERAKYSARYQRACHVVPKCHVTISYGPIWLRS
jgi:hypothetical protein